MTSGVISRTSGQLASVAVSDNDILSEPCDQSECDSTHQVRTYFGPTFTVYADETFKCMLERDHAGELHMGSPIGRPFESWATWPES